MILPEVLVFSHAALAWAARDGRRRTGSRIRDRRGRMIDIGDWRPEDWDGLLAMYRSFEPAQRVDGLPPLGEDRLAVWVDMLWRSGPNFVARAGDQVVGHAALVRDGDGYELMVFVHPDQQGAGIGRAMVDEALACARRAGIERVWLSVEQQNARELYRRMGLQQVSEEGREEEVWAFGAQPAPAVPPRITLVEAARAMLSGLRRAPASTGR